MCSAVYLLFPVVQGEGRAQSRAQFQDPTVTVAPGDVCVMFSRIFYLNSTSQLSTLSSIDH